MKYFRLGYYDNEAYLFPLASNTVILLACNRRIGKEVEKEMNKVIDYTINRRRLGKPSLLGEIK